MSAAPQSKSPRLTPVQWLICTIAVIGFAFDTYEILMLPLIAPTALPDLTGAQPGSPVFQMWVGRLFYVPAFAAGIFGLLGGYLTDRFGRRRVLTFSILLYAVAAFSSGYATSIEMLLALRCCVYVGVCVEFVAAVAWLAELFPDPLQRERILGYTQACSNFGGLLVASASALCVAYADRLPALSSFGLGDASSHAAWRYTLMTGVIPALPLILIRPFLPESPVWREKRAAGTLKRPSIRELFAPKLRRATIVSTIMLALAYGAAFGALQQVPQMIRGIPEVREQIGNLPLVEKLVQDQDKSLILRDENGNYHFSGRIHNIKDVTRALDSLREHPGYADLVDSDLVRIKAMFENVFQHNQFTGRSGTFFAYEGLGSIYWHMVSKLLLAVQETILRTREEATTQALMENYVDIRKGLSFNKSPDAYGAFPTDPYSHTPKGQGARQPGMSGMVKEEILTRQKELGFSVTEGCISFDFLLLDRSEFLTNPSPFVYWNISGKREQIDLPAGTIAYSICQVPVILRASDESCIDIHFADDRIQRFDGHVLDLENGGRILQRDGTIHHLVISCR